MFDEPKYTAEEWSKVFSQSKPHLQEIEDVINTLPTDYGQIVVTLDIRAGVVNKMTFTKASTWLRDKSLTQK